ncbi:MAG: TatD family hydrolase [Candidatus Hodarchaeales archaeon]
MVHDAHAHLLPQFIENPLPLLEDPDVEMVANSALSLEQYRYALDLEKKSAKVITSLGIPPQMLHKMDKGFADEALEFMIAHRSEIKAVGEIGMDYHWVQDEVLIREQKRVFIAGIQVANQLGLPLVIHSRKAEKDCLVILEKHAEVPVLMHCFAGTIEDLKKVIDLDFFLTVPTAVCTRKKFAKIAKRAPLEKILLETDSPFLSPIRGEQNRPSFIKYSEKKIALLKDLPLEDVIESNKRNFVQFYLI